MNRNELLSERMKKLNDEALEDFHIEDFNLKEKTFAAPNTKIKWLRILAEEQKLLVILENNMDELRNQVLKDQFNMTAPQIRKEIEVEKNKDVLKLKKAINSQKDLIRFVDGIVKVAYGLGFDIKSCIDIVKLESS